MYNLVNVEIIYNFTSFEEINVLKTLPIGENEGHISLNVGYWREMFSKVGAIYGFSSTTNNYIICQRHPPDGQMIEETLGKCHAISKF